MAFSLKRATIIVNVMLDHKFMLQHLNGGHHHSVTPVLWLVILAAQTIEIQKTYVCWLLFDTG